MNQRKLSHVMAAGILAALLVLPAAAWAAPAHEHSPAAGAWSWLNGLWGRGVSFLLNWAEEAAQDWSPDAGLNTKGGDPDGVNIQGQSSPPQDERVLRGPTTPG